MRTGGVARRVACRALGGHTGDRLAPYCLAQCSIGDADASRAARSAGTQVSAWRPTASRAV